MRPPSDLRRWAEQLKRCAEELRRQLRDVPQGSLLWECSRRQAVQACRIVIAALDADVEYLADGCIALLDCIRRSSSSEHLAWPGMTTLADGKTPSEEACFWLFRSGVCHEVLAGDNERGDDAGLLWLRYVPDEYKLPPPSPERYGYADGSPMVPLAPPPTHKPADFDAPAEFEHLRAEVADWAETCQILADRLIGIAGVQEVEDSKAWDELIVGASSGDGNDRDQEVTNLVSDSVEEINNADAYVLSHRQDYLLEALLDLGATTAASRVTTTEAAKKAEGDQANPAKFKESVSDLRKRKLICTKSGRGGGIWLLPSGVKRAEELKQNR